MKTKRRKRKRSKKLNKKRRQMGKICQLKVPKQRMKESHVLRRGRPRERPAENRVPARDPVPSLARDRGRGQDQGQGRCRSRVHVHVRVRHPNLDRGLDRARVLSRVRRLNRDLDPAVLNQGICRDLDPSRDRARERLLSHRRGLDRARDPSPGRGQDRDPVLVAVAVPLARAAKAAPRASELYFKQNIDI